MRRDRVRPWQRLAALRAGRRRGTALPPPERVHPAENLPPLEPPDDDREFLLSPCRAELRLEAAGGAAG